MRDLQWHLGEYKATHLAEESAVFLHKGKAVRQAHSPLKDFRS